MASNKSAVRVTVHRSSKNGRFVKEEYAKRHPSITEKERVQRSK